MSTGNSTKRIMPYGKPTHFGKVDSSTTRLPMKPETDTSKYSAEVIAYAEQLKGAHESGDKPLGFSDEYYLEYAQRAFNGSRAAKYNFVTAQKDAVPDPRYAQYSYEEIIGMANNGVAIPKDVLAWAQAHQEADVTDYVVIDDTTETTDTNPDNNDTTGSDVNKLRSQTQEYIKKSTKAQVDLETNNAKIKDLTTETKELYLKQKNLFDKNSIDEMDSKVKQWKSLDEKQKNGELTNFEKVLYKKLTKELKANNDTVKEIKSNAQNLDNFLNSIDNLKDKSSDALEIAQDTLDAAEKLSKDNKILSSLNKTHTYKETAAMSDIALSNMLSGMSDVEISYTAEKYGQDLQNYGNEIQTDLNSDSNKELIEFAQNYKTGAETVSEVSNTIQEREDKSADKKQKDSSEAGLYAATTAGFTMAALTNPTFAFAFSLATLSKAAETGVETTVLNALSLITNKDSKNVEKGEKKLEEDTSAKVNRFGKNKEQIEEKTEKLETLGYTSNAEETGAKEQAPETFAAVSESEIPTPDKAIFETPENSNENPEKETLEKEITELTEDNKEIQKDVKKPLDEETKSIQRSKNSQKKSDGRNTQVKESVSMLNKMTGTSLAMGTALSLASIYNVTTGTAVMAEGLGLMSNIFTYSAGVILFAQGTALLNYGVLQQAAGITANTTALAGAATSAASTVMTKTVDSIVKTTDNSNKKTQKTVDETAKAIDSLDKGSENGNKETTETQDSTTQPEVQEKTETNPDTNTLIQENINTKSDNNTVQTNSQENGEKTTAANSGKTQTTESDKTQNDKAKDKGTEKAENQNSSDSKDVQKGIKSQYGSNSDYKQMLGGSTALMVAARISPLLFISLAIANTATVGASVLDLTQKNNTVDKSEEAAKQTVDESKDKADSLKKQSAQIKASHDKNLKQVQTLQAEYKSLNEDSTNQMFEYMQSQQELVKSGEITPDQVVESEDPNLEAKAGIKKSLSAFGAKEAQLFASMDKPLETASKTTDNSKESVKDFSGLNEKLSDRNDNNSEVGKLIIGEAAVCQGIITATIAMLMGFGIFSFGLVKLWLLALAENIAVGSSGAGALVVSNQVKGDIQDNENTVKKDNQSLFADDKTFTDQRKVIAKLENETSKEAKKFDNIPEAQKPEVNEASAQTQETSSNENQNETSDEVQVSKAKSSSNISNEFSKTSSNSDLDTNKPEDLKYASNYAARFTQNVQQNENTQVSASATANAGVSRYDRNKVTETKLTRFNKDGAIDSKRMSQKVNSVNGIEYRRRRR